MAQHDSINLINPHHQILMFPDHGYEWMDSEHAIDSCMAPADSLWIQQSGDDFDLYVASDGPHGSGRYWTVTIALKNSDEEKPSHGICLETSTIGWRTLQYFKKLPLPWVDDQNNNGQPEFILWDSFPLNDEPTMAEFGLIGWVYELDQEGALKLNLTLTRTLATQIASAYRVPISDTDTRFQQMRDKIAHILDEFASD